MCMVSSAVVNKMYAGAITARMAATAATRYAIRHDRKYTYVRTYLRTHAVVLFCSGVTIARRLNTAMRCILSEVVRVALHSLPETERHNIETCACTNTYACFQVKVDDYGYTHFARVVLGIGSSSAGSFVNTYFLAKSDA